MVVDSKSAVTAEVIPGVRAPVAMAFVDVAKKVGGCIVVTVVDETEVVVFITIGPGDPEDAGSGRVVDSSPSLRAWSLSPAFSCTRTAVICASRAAGGPLSV